MTPASVRLADLTVAHVDAMYRWMCDPIVSQNIGLRSEPSLEKTRAWVERATTDDTIEARAILLDGVHVGNVVLDRIDRHVSRARLSIYIGEAVARGRGVGRSAVTLASELAFDALDLEKVWLTVHAKNVTAIAAYEAAGFVVEGVHRGEFLLTGVRCDEIYMGILRADRVHAAGKR